MTKGKIDLEKLDRLIARLRAPEGCPWDREQTLRDVRAYLLEEAHEVAAAIDESPEEPSAALGEELGDLLFQLVFIARLAEEQGLFHLGQVIDGIHDKMVARHPHVFGEEGTVSGGRMSSGEVVEAWERRKREESPRGSSLLAGLAPSLPALLRTYRMSQKAAGVGFDWPRAGAVLDKVEEEIAELRRALDTPDESSRSGAVREELGDLLFSVANLARHLSVDPEAALAQSNRKFERRFAFIERELERRGEDLHCTGLERLEELWEKAKRLDER